MARTRFNPLDKKNLGISVADAVIDEPLESLATLEPFEGAGIYALYYSGDFELYADMVSFCGREGIEWPIYVGKAIPPGSRTGQFGLDPDPKQALYKRLCEHRSSINAASNLAVEDFGVRALLVDDIWIPLGEALLISRFCPPWNTCVQGFGIHHPGGGRAGQAPSEWDVLHPGRSWVKSLTGVAAPTPEILSRLQEHIAATCLTLSRREA